MSRSRRGVTGLSGVLLIDKPAGMTSHDVVSAVRRATGERRVGHAGTLDPAATGLLVVLVGPATRLAPYLTAADKSYEATVVFGTRTDTDDVEGAVVETAPVPPALSDPAFARDLVDGLKGVSEQLPPSYSAIKRDGKVAHRAARQGAPLELQSRTIEVLDARLKSVTDSIPLVWDLTLTVSKGTYVRAIARDLGHTAGTVAHLGALRRTASGPARLADAHTLAEVVDAGPAVDRLFADPVPLLAMPALEADAHAAAAVAHGAPVAAALADEAPGDAVAVVRGDRLLGIYRRRGHDDMLKAEIVVPGGVSR